MRRRERWHEIPGVFALAVIALGLPAVAVIYAALFFVIHGRLPL